MRATVFAGLLFSVVLPLSFHPRGAALPKHSLYVGFHGGNATCTDIYMSGRNRMKEQCRQMQMVGSQPGMIHHVLFVLIVFDILFELYTLCGVL